MSPLAQLLMGSLPAIGAGCGLLNSASQMSAAGNAANVSNGCAMFYNPADLSNAFMVPYASTGTTLKTITRFRGSKYQDGPGRKFGGPR